MTEEEKVYQFSDEIRKILEGSGLAVDAVPFQQELQESASR